MFISVELNICSPDLPNIFATWTKTHKLYNLILIVYTKLLGLYIMIN